MEEQKQIYRLYQNIRMLENAHYKIFKEVLNGLKLWIVWVENAFGIHERWLECEVDIYLSAAGPIHDKSIRGFTQGVCDWQAWYKKSELGLNPKKHSLLCFDVCYLDTFLLSDMNHVWRDQIKQYNELYF